jgi:hypothetical protein
MRSHCAQRVPNREAPLPISEMAVISASRSETGVFRPNRDPSSNTTERAKPSRLLTYAARAQRSWGSSSPAAHVQIRRRWRALTRFWLFTTLPPLYYFWCFFARGPTPSCGAKIQTEANVEVSSNHYPCESRFGLQRGNRIANQAKHPMSEGPSPK